MSVDKLQQSYEEVPYPDLCYTQTHPDRLATLATLLGLRPPSLTNCRVLELGCASGGNLIPMAYGLPESEFLGIDFSAAQIEAGQKTITALGLKNIDLQQKDILELAPDFGEFDYIIAHGVYSWVPEAVRDRLLAICKGSLSPNGIAYISYNTLPGWHMLGALRNMMLYHTRDIDDPQERVGQARGLLNFLAESVPSREDPYGTFLNAYGNMLNAYNSFVTMEREKEHSGFELLLHDELEAVNDPVYFHEFAAHAAEHGLQYLVEADFARVVPTNFPPEVSQALFKMSRDIIEVEQYMDFLRNRTLRQTLICHDEILIQRTLRPDPGLFSPFYVATYAQPDTPDINMYDASVAKFRGPDGSILSIDHPVSKVAMLYLAQISPQAVPFGALLELAVNQIYDKVDKEPDGDTLIADAQMLTANFMRAYSYSMRLVELHIHASQFVLEAGEKPIASSPARLQARAGHLKVTNLRHERVKLDHVSQHLLPAMDGSRDRAGLLDILMELAARGRIGVESEGQPVPEGVMMREILAQELELSLRWLGRAALLQS